MYSHYSSYSIITVFVTISLCSATCLLRILLTGTHRCGEFVYSPGCLSISNPRIYDILLSGRADHSTQLTDLCQVFAVVSGQCNGHNADTY